MEISIIGLMKSAHIATLGMLVLFIVVIPPFTMAIPTVAFAMIGFAWMMFVHFLMNFPIISEKEMLLYSESESEEFINLKLKATVKLLVIGTVLTVLLFIVFSSIAYIDTESAIPRIDAVSAFVLFSATFMPFIPATLSLMSASYTYDAKNMGILTIFLVVLLWVLVVVPLLNSGLMSDSFIPEVPSLNTFSYVIVGVAVMVVSILLSTILLKNIKRAFKIHVFEYGYHL
ncbi:hypothetical protein Mpt1_c09310 [Candidatus Methanoplasma termitum]|uniref:Uncharacterized protein n=1 Tax=Candidatus Methanoplasma termitum TaxID=1577791 RepID=A0A0A7LH13_9ARCH|nr:hypothetical protein [Candidatus Methanoplasma termitum]AIZ56806.1 hypothetical protein Mpt1_c09310 [Candidatus Methanoplasma termitum]MCL2333494.1 hypothetical protein [Candidatus Methanoplasma sp.]